MAFSGSNGVQAKPYCSVSEEYLEKHGELNQESYHLNKDFSCLTDLAALRDDLSSYQKIDIRTSSRSFDEIDDTWRMTIRELQSSRALRDRSLLLLDDGFSRINSAKDCASLKKAGYTDVKILVGGADTWRAENQQRYRNSFGAPKTVTARQFLHEYFNGDLVLIAANDQIAHELASLGLSEKPHVANAGDLSVLEIILSSTLRNQSSELVDSFDFISYAPVNREAYQDIQFIDSSHEYVLSGDWEA